MRILASPAPPEPTARFDGNVPAFVTITANEAAYYAEACAAFRHGGVIGSSTGARELEAYPGLTEADACDWVVFGFTPGGLVDMELFLAAAAAHAQDLRVWGRTTRDLYETLVDRLNAWHAQDLAAETDGQP